MASEKGGTRRWDASGPQKVLFRGIHSNDWLDMSRKEINNDSIRGRLQEK